MGMMEFMADPATEQMINEMMTEIMRPPTEEETAMMMSLVEEMMQMPSEEQKAQMEDLQMMMQMMEMKSHCKCTSSDVAYGEMAMPTMPMAAGKLPSFEQHFPLFPQAFSCPNLLATLALLHPPHPSSCPERSCPPPSRPSRA